VDWVCITPCHCRTRCITAQHALPLHRLEKNNKVGHQTLDALLLAVKSHANFQGKKWYAIFKSGDSRGPPPPEWVLREDDDHDDHGDA